MADPNARDLKLIQYLNEAYGTEKQLETALEAHIAMTTRAPYRKRLRQHLTETKRHARDVERRIKQLGGTADGLNLPERAADAANALQTVVGKAAAAAQGPIHMLRGTSEAEKQLKNAKTEYASEAEEIATYRAIEEFAERVGDKDTQRLARSIRRDEERMAAFLERQIPQLARAVAVSDIPAAERNGARRRSTRRRSSASSRSGSSSRSSSGGRSSASKRSSSARSSSGRKSASSRSRSGGSRRRAKANA